MRGPAATPRVEPLAADQQTDAQRELLSKVDVRGVLGQANIFTTLVQAPEVFRPWLRFGGSLLGGTLPARDRELLILRSAVNCTAPYEWSQHVSIGKRAGLSDEEIARIAVAGLDDWSDVDRAVLQAADELHENYSLCDETYAALAARYDVVQLIEFTSVVGHYHLLAMTLNTLGTPLDEGLPGLPS